MSRFLSGIVFVTLALCGAASAAPYHTADTAPDYLITLSELLRVIQFYNVGGLHCEVGTEDGFAVGAGDTGCTPHDSDYAPQDWSISLSELLRVIQFYNTPGYHPCAEGEDGYCAGLQGVGVPDPALEAALRDALDKPAGPLLPAELAGLSTLEAAFGGITDLTGLEACTGLTTLDLHGNCIADLSPLAGLTSLEVLNLHDNAIVDVLPLVGLSQLRLLWLDHNQIADPAPLALNLGLGNAPANTWDRVALAFNPLDDAGAAQALAELRARDVRVWSDTPPGAASGACAHPLQGGDPVPIDVHLIHGDPALDDARCMVLVLLGDAYTEADLNDPDIAVADVPANGYASGERSWSKIAADAMRFLFTQEPFTEYAAYFKVYRVDLLSNENLLSDNRVAPPLVYDTALHVATESRGFSFDLALLDRVADATALPRDRIVLIPNGAGNGDNVGDVTMFNNTRTSRTMTCVHELGHGLGGLTDEYEYKHGTSPPTSEAPATRAFANAVSVGDRVPNLDEIPWKHWIEAACPAPDTHLGETVNFLCVAEDCQCDYTADFADCVPLPTCEPGGNYVDVDGKIYGRSAWPEPDESTPVGLYEGAWFRQKGAYRPELRCRMRSDDDVEPGLQETPKFCKVCREAMNLAIVSNTGSVAAVFPSTATTLQLSTASPMQAFSVTLHSPASPGHVLEVVSWEVDGVLQGGATTVDFLLNPATLTAGPHEVAVTLADRSDFVLPNYVDGQELLRQRVVWTVDVGSTK